MIRFHALPWMDRAVAWQVPMVRVMPRGSVTGQGGGGCHRSKIACCSGPCRAPAEWEEPAVGSPALGGRSSLLACGSVDPAQPQPWGGGGVSRTFEAARATCSAIRCLPVAPDAGARPHPPPAPRRPRLHHAPLRSPLRSSDRPTSRRRAGVCKDQGLWGGVPSLLHKPSRGVGCVLRSQTPGSRASHTPSRRAVLLLASHPSGPALI